MLLDCAAASEDKAADNNAGNGSVSDTSARRKKIIMDYPYAHNQDDADPPQRRVENSRESVTILLSLTKR